MSAFGRLLRQHRHGCRDPLTGNTLTQERLGELIGRELGGSGYSAVAVSNWERGRSSIHADDRLVLTAIIAILHRLGGLASLAEANALLHAGNYRALNDEERAAVFGSQFAAEDSSATGSVPGIESDPTTGNGSATVATTPPENATKSTSPSQPLDRKRELILLEKVRRFWIEGVLEDSLANFTTIELRAEEVPGAVMNVWGNVATPPPGKITHTLNDQTLVDLFSSSGAAMLILGSPGAGKTFTLLRLARQLLQRAEADPLKAIPVVLNLSSWAENEEGLGEWVLEELTAKYQIPNKFGRTWLENDRLILLLDGLDEVPQRVRPSCVAAINRFRRDFGFTGIVVCSRVSTYDAAENPLMLDKAIQISRLEPDQIIEILNFAGATTEEIRRQMADERTLRLVQSPLVVRVLASLRESKDGLFSAQPARAQHDDQEDYLSALIDGYVEQMLAESEEDEAFRPERTKQWLGWLAARMAEHNQAELYVERIQPSWLPGVGWKWFYMYVTRLVDGAMAGIILWLLLLQLRVVHPDLPIGATRWLASAGGSQMSLATREFIWLVGSNIFLGLLVATVEIFFYERQPLSNLTRLTPHQRHIVQIAVVGILVGVVTYAIGFRLGDPLLIAFWSLVQAIVHMLMARFIHGANYRTEFRSMNAIAWSWRRTGIGLVAGCSMAVFAELLEYGYGVENGTWSTFLAYGAAGVLLGGLSGQRIEQKARPNQGMRQAATNATLAAVIAVPTMGILALLLWDLSSLPITIALILFSAFTFFGGSAVFNHFLLRFIFWYDDLIPGDLVRLLNQATAHALMRKVGGGFIFAHPLIQDHFRRLNVRETE